MVRHTDSISGRDTEFLKALQLKPRHITAHHAWEQRQRGYRQLYEVDSYMSDDGYPTHRHARESVCSPYSQRETKL